MAAGMRYGWVVLVLVAILHLQPSLADACEHGISDSGNVLKLITKLETLSTAFYLHPLPGFSQAILTLNVQSSFSKSVFLGASVTFINGSASQDWHHIQVNHTRHNMRHSLKLFMDGQEIPLSDPNQSNQGRFVTAYNFYNYELKMAGPAKWSICTPHGNETGGGFTNSPGNQFSTLPNATETSRQSPTRSSTSQQSSTRSSTSHQSSTRSSTSHQSSNRSSTSHQPSTHSSTSHQSSTPSVIETSPDVSPTTPPVETINFQCTFTRTKVSSQTPKHSTLSCHSEIEEERGGNMVWEVVDNKLTDNADNKRMDNAPKILYHIPKPDPVQQEVQERRSKQEIIYLSVIVVESIVIVIVIVIVGIVAVRYRQQYGKDSRPDQKENDVEIIPLNKKDLNYRETKLLLISGTKPSDRDVASTSL